MLIALAARTSRRPLCVGTYSRSAPRATNREGVDRVKRVSVVWCVGRAAQNFYGECGTALTSACPACGASAAPGQRFVRSVALCSARPRRRRRSRPRTTQPSCFDLDAENARKFTGALDDTGIEQRGEGLDHDVANSIVGTLLIQLAAWLPHGQADGGCSGWAC